jgi:hypothetical protein
VTSQPNRPSGEHGRGWRRDPRRLGTLEYALLALIVLCVAITIVMAVLNPGG